MRPFRQRVVQANSNVCGLITQPRTFSLKFCMGPTCLGVAQPNSSSSSNGISSSKLTQATGSSLVCRAYVGQENPLAGEYHSTDYDWTEHAQQTAELVEKQWAAAPAAVRQAAQLDSSGRPLSAVQQLLLSLRSTSNTSSSVNSKETGCNACASTNSSSPSNSPGLAFRELQASAQPSHTQHAAGDMQTCTSQTSQQLYQQASIGHQSQPASANEWEVFYRAHPSARFYKERRYLLLEFPCLAPPATPQHIVEIGAGCGSSILPVLRAQPSAVCTVCDVSPTCLQQLQDAMRLLRLSPERVTSFVADGTDPALGQRLAGCKADVALIMFTLSAVQPEGMLHMMQNARASLRPGGLLCIRDHALYDMVQLRIPPEQCIGRHIYRRGDDTLAYFYTTEELAGLAIAAGLEVVECEYVRVINKNRRTGQELRRAFVHGVFKRPVEKL